MGIAGLCDAFAYADLEDVLKTATRACLRISF